MVKKYRYGEQKKINGKQKKEDFAVTFLKSFFKSGMGKLSKSMEKYTPPGYISLKGTVQ